MGLQLQFIYLPGISPVRWSSEQKGKRQGGKQRLAAAYWWYIQSVYTMSLPIDFPGIQIFTPLHTHAKTLLHFFYKFIYIRMPSSISYQYYYKWLVIVTSRYALSHWDLSPRTHWLVTLGSYLLGYSVRITLKINAIAWRVHFLIGRSNRRVKGILNRNSLEHKSAKSLRNIFISRDVHLWPLFYWITCDILSFLFCFFFYVTDHSGPVPYTCDIVLGKK